MPSWFNKLASWRCCYEPLEVTRLILDKHPPKKCEEGCQRGKRGCCCCSGCSRASPPEDIALNIILFLLPGVKQLIGDNMQRRNWMCFSLFEIKNRYKNSLYKYTRELQHVVNPSPLQRARNCSGVTHIWKDRIIQRNGALTCMPRMQLQQQLYQD